MRIRFFSFYLMIKTVKHIYGDICDILHVEKEYVEKKYVEKKLF